MRKWLILLITLSISFSIQIDHIINTNLDNATLFEPFNKNFYVINGFDGRIYTLDNVGGVLNTIKARNLYVYDIESFKDKLIYVSDLGVYQLKPSIKVLTKIYGFNKVGFNDKFYVFGTVYHALVSYTSNFSFINKIGGVNQPNELIVGDVKVKNNTVFVSDIYHGKLLTLSPSLRIVKECNINISTFDVINDTIIGFSENRIVVIKNCTIIDSLILNNVKDIESSNGKIFALINTSIYEIKDIKKEEKEEEKEEVNENLEKEENTTSNIKHEPQKINKKIVEEKEERKEEIVKTSNSIKNSISKMVLIGITLLIILGIILLLLKPKRRYRRKK